MDIQMPELDGIEATRFITGRQPAPRVVMLTMNEDDDTVLSAIRAGASGYLLKGSSADGGAERRPRRRRGRHGLRRGAGRTAWRRTSPRRGRRRRPRSRSPISPTASGRCSTCSPPGKSNDAIARELFVSGKTVRNTVSSIYTKLHAAGRGEAIVKAREAGYGRE